MLMAFAIVLGIAYCLFVTSEPCDPRADARKLMLFRALDRDRLCLTYPGRSTMMIFTTLLVSAITVAALYFLVVRYLPWQGLSYGLMILVGVVCLFPGDVHFRY